MTKLEKIATSSNCNFREVSVFVPLQKQFVLITNKSFHVCTVITVLHIFHKIFGIR